MFARIARQYRRFLLGSLLLSGMMVVVVLTGEVDWPENLVHPVLGPLAWAITMLIVIGLPVVVLSLILPGLLPLIELWLIAIIGLGLIDPLLRPAMDKLGVPGWTYCLMLVAAFIITERALYGPWLQNLWRRDMKKESATLTVPGTPEDIWCKLFPDPDHAGTYFWPGARFLAAPDESKAAFLLNLPRYSAAKDALHEVHIEKASAPSHFRYDARPLPGCTDPRQRTAVEITKLDDTHCRVTYTQQFLNVAFGQRLFFYLNNDFRDTLASLRARLSGRKDRSLQGHQMLQS